MVFLHRLLAISNLVCQLPETTIYCSAIVFIEKNMRLLWMQKCLFAEFLKFQNQTACKSFDPYLRGRFASSNRDAVWNFHVNTTMPAKFEP